MVNVINAMSGAHLISLLRPPSFLDNLRQIDCVTHKAGVNVLIFMMLIIC